MAVRWSSENVVAEHRDLQASAMALDCNGEYTILAGRRYLALISLERPTEIIKRVSRTQQKYDVIACEWHPSQAERNTFVIAFGERAEVCMWDEGHLKTLHVLRAHTRTVTDLNWHRTDPHVLATCSIDTFVHIWDVREARKPVTSLTSIAGATQVKWNKINQHFLASGHDCDIRVWDDRKTSQPLHYISAHLSKINGLDWSPNHEHHLVSASNDCSVKFFDITNARKEENFINTHSPVWRAKYTPFGEGVVTVVMPQLRRGENSLLLWSVTDVGAPAHTFVGHTDVVLEFEWRQSLSNPGDIQMVSWARDHSLRIWNIDHQLQRMCGHEAEDESMLMESTDSELASEPPIMQGESEPDMEKLDPNDSPLALEGESIKSINDGCSPDQAQNVPKILQEGSSKITGGIAKEIEVSRSTPVLPSTELPLSSQQESDATVHLDPTPESTLASTPTSSQLMENLPNVSTPSKSGSINVGMSSTLPSMNHPMTLHQEFSLLNTHLDNNQGNSLDVSAGRIAMLSEIGGRTFNQGMNSFEQEPVEFEHDASNFEREPSSFDNESSTLDGPLNPLHCDENNLVAERNHIDDGNDLVSAVKKLARELEKHSHHDCSVAALPSNDRSSVTCERSDSVILSHSEDCQSASGNIVSMKESFKEFVSSYPCNMNSNLLDAEKSGNPDELNVNYANNELNENSYLRGKVGTSVLSNEPGNSQVQSLLDEKHEDACETDAEPAKISFRSQSDGHFHSEHMSENFTTSYILTSGHSEAYSVKIEEAESYSVQVETVKPYNLNVEKRSQSEMKDLPPSEELTFTSVSENDKDETVIYVVENESSENISMQSLAASVKSAICRSKGISNNATPAAIHKDVTTDGLSHPTENGRIENGQLMLSLSPPLVDVNVGVMEGSVMVKCSNDASIQVPAKLVYLPNPENLEATEEDCAMLAPQLLEGGVLSPGNNIMIFKNQCFLISVNALVWDGEKQHTQISISSPVESMETYQANGTNFVMITGSSEQSLTTSMSSQAADGISICSSKFPVKNAPNSDEPGVFQCDKCDKSYKVRSSLNSHKVTHNTEKFYKCDECDKAFHYSTPLQIHKRVHSDERPYHCPSCSASFRSKANLKYHERLHSGERPIMCQECGQGFKDYTSLKRHKAKAHDLVTIKCEECGHICNSVEHLTTHLWQIHNILYVDKVLYKCEKCGETFSFQKSYNNHIANHRRGEKCPQGSLGRLTDYTYRCGICNMTCNNKSQMVSHVQVHAAFKRYVCRYCKGAYMYNFLLVNHVREEHPNEPLWFCQHCDVVFKTCRALNGHSCRSVRGNYTCHHCDFKTEIRHRLFRHIVKTHPEDSTPYYCDFCKSGFEDPNKLRYHQKREHPEEMLTLAMQRESLKNPSATVEKLDVPPFDMSQIEMSIEGNTIVYHIPKHLRDDEVFQEKVKFKCYYCEAKFPVKNVMTRHILKEHPGKKAYKCLNCNIFFKTTIDSKNHNRKYHKFRETDGRDPLRNVKAMKKKAQWFKEQFEKSGPKVRNTYKFSCRFCPMAYRCRRHLIFHYKKWHPEEEWDYLPNKSYQLSGAKKKRKLIFFDCVFDSKCQVVFDDKGMMTEHILNAHGIVNEEADKYIRTRTVVDIVHRGRIPRNAVNLLKSNEVENKNLYSEMENEEDVDDLAAFDDINSQVNDSHSNVEDLRCLKKKLEGENCASLFVRDKPFHSQRLEKRAFRSQPRLDTISSMKDVKKLLYRCRKCCLYFSKKSEYREHNSRYRDVDCRDFLHLNMKQESDDEASDIDDDLGNYNATKSDYESKKNDTYYTVETETKKEMGDPENGGYDSKKNDTFYTVETECKKDMGNIENGYDTLGVMGSITVAVLEDLAGEDTKVLHINEAEMHCNSINSPSNLGFGCSNKKTLTFNVERTEIEGSFECLSKNVMSSTDRKEKKILSQSCSEQTILKAQSKLSKNVCHSSEISSPRVLGQVRSGNVTRKSVSQKMHCEICNTLFKTRAELGFHKRYEH
ncbi:uncharacterized protein Wdr59 isoform X1 [Palaemon carinicauda]|uniref:uncharacterized protein Wdr59 isoform X1 n=1 Tax=Palaemon carinicauda TaxID=392227 RepID=UPI0035B61965